MRPEIKHSLDEYAMNRRPVGDFLAAVLANDLMDAIARADAGNRYDLFDICSYVYNNMPTACHGSRAKVAAWIAPHRSSASPTTEGEK